MVKKISCITILWLIIGYSTDKWPTTLIISLSRFKKTKRTGGGFSYRLHLYKGYICSYKIRCTVSVDLEEQSKKANPICLKEIMPSAGQELNGYALILWAIVL